MLTCRGGFTIGPILRPDLTDRMPCHRTDLILSKGDFDRYDDIQWYRPPRVLFRSSRHPVDTQSKILVYRFEERSFSELLRLSERRLRRQVLTLMLGAR